MHHNRSVGLLYKNQRIRGGRHRLYPKISVSGNSEFHPWDRMAPAVNKSGTPVPQSVGQEFRKSRNIAGRYRGSAYPSVICSGKFNACWPHFHLQLKRLGKAVVLFEPSIGALRVEVTPAYTLAYEDWVWTYGFRLVEDIPPMNGDTRCFLFPMRPE